MGGRLTHHAAHEMLKPGALIRQRRTLRWAWHRNGKISTSTHPGDLCMVISAEVSQVATRPSLEVEALVGGEVFSCRTFTSVWEDGWEAA